MKYKCEEAEIHSEGLWGGRCDIKLTACDNVSPIADTYELRKTSIPLPKCENLTHLSAKTSELRH